MGRPKNGRQSKTARKGAPAEIQNAVKAAVAKTAGEIGGDKDAGARSMIARLGAADMAERTCAAAAIGRLVAEDADALRLIVKSGGCQALLECIGAPDSDLLARVEALGAARNLLIADSDAGRELLQLGATDAVASVCAGLVDGRFAGPPTENEQVQDADDRRKLALDAAEHVASLVLSLTEGQTGGAAVRLCVRPVVAVLLERLATRGSSDLAAGALISGRALAALLERNPAAGPVLVGLSDALSAALVADETGSGKGLQLAAVVLNVALLAHEALGTSSPAGQTAGLYERLLSLLGTALEDFGSRNGLEHGKPSDDDEPMLRLLELATNALADADEAEGDGDWVDADDVDEMAVADPGELSASDAEDAGAAEMAVEASGVSEAKVKLAATLLQPEWASRVAAVAASTDNISASLRAWGLLTNALLCAGAQADVKLLESMRDQTCLIIGNVMGGQNPLLEHVLSNAFAQCRAAPRLWQNDAAMMLVGLLQNASVAGREQVHVVHALTVLGTATEDDKLSGLIGTVMLQSLEKSAAAAVPARVGQLAQAVDVQSELLNALFDIFADETAPIDLQVFYKQRFHSQLAALEPRLRATVRRLDKRLHRAVRERADEALLNLRAFLEYKRRDYVSRGLLDF